MSISTLFQLRDNTYLQITYCSLVAFDRAQAITPTQGMAPRRPSAFEVSFPEEAKAAEAAEQELLNRTGVQPRSSSAASTSSLGKRKAPDQIELIVCISFSR